MSRFFLFLFLTAVNVYGGLFLFSLVEKITTEWICVGTTIMLIFLCCVFEVFAMITLVALREDVSEGITL